MVRCAFVCVWDPHPSAQLTVEALNDCYYACCYSLTERRVAAEIQRQKVKTEEDSDEAGIATVRRQSVAGNSHISFSGHIYTHMPSLSPGSMFLRLLRGS